jgi:cytidylate kinase
MAILTVSREYGSGGTEIGEAVARVMGYGYVDRDTVLHDLHEAGPRWEEWAKELDEHGPTVWERYDWSFRGFVALVQSRVLEYALSDRVVIMGRGANLLLRGIPSAYRIRVVAPLEVRVERIAKREQVNRETARWLAEKTDAERSSFIHAIYGAQWNDPAQYDAVFEVTGQEIDVVVEAVKGALLERERHDTAEVKRTLQLRAAAARLKAGIATNPSFFVPVLDVSTEGDGLVIRGVVHNPKEHRRLEEEARKLAGELPVRCELHYRG